MPLFSSLKIVALDLLFPLRCAGCGKEGVALCPACSANLHMIAPSCFVCKKLVPEAGKIPSGRTCTPCRKKTKIYAFLSPFSYGTPAIKTLIHDLKYRRVRPHAEVLADMLGDYLRYFRISLPRDGLLIPIPLHKSREAARGFNQSFLIARSLGEKFGVKTPKDILQKIKSTKPQMELTREERLKNAIGTFAVSDRKTVANRTIILLDDVKTTGATLEEAAHTLKASGAKKIWAITIAH